MATPAAESGGGVAGPSNGGESLPLFIQNGDAAAVSSAGLSSNSSSSGSGGGEVVARIRDLAQQACRRWRRSSESRATRTERTTALAREVFEYFVAASPFLAYLVVFKHYQFLRDATGMEQLTPPNKEVLPWLEQTVFGCMPHQVLAQYASPWFDFIAAIPYLVHFPLPLLFIIYLALKRSRRKHIKAFIWLAGWVNFLALCVQFTFPTAPPWYTDSAIFAADGHLVRSANNEAGFERLDVRFRMRLFHNIYGASPVKFGAMPSLHVAWPAIILVAGPWIGERFATMHLVWIAWAALYSNHHYGVDAMAGITLAFVVNLCMVYIWCPFKPCSIFLPEENDGRPPSRTKRMPHQV